MYFSHIVSSVLNVNIVDLITVHHFFCFLTQNDGFILRFLDVKHLQGSVCFAVRIHFFICS